MPNTQRLPLGDPASFLGWHSLSHVKSLSWVMTFQSEPEEILYVPVQDLAYIPASFTSWVAGCTSRYRKWARVGLPNCSLEEETLYCFSIAKPTLEGPISGYWFMKTLGRGWDTIRKESTRLPKRRSQCCFFLSLGTSSCPRSCHHSLCQGLECQTPGGCMACSVLRLVAHLICWKVKPTFQESTSPEEKNRL